MSTNMFLQLKSIDGESEDEKHANWIEIIGWGHSFEQPASGFRTSSGSTLEKCKHELLTVTKYIDKASTAILKAVWSGKQLDDATVECFRADGDNVPVKYLKIFMEDVIISTFSISGGEGDIPQEELGLSYATIQYEYTPQDKALGTPGSAMTGKHNLVKNVVS